MKTDLYVKEPKGLGGTYKHRVRATMLGDASLEVLQKQRVAAELVCCCQVLVESGVHSGHQERNGERNEAF